MNVDLQGPHNQQSRKGEVVPDSDALPRLAIGVMTGTSLDGIDAVLIQSTGRGVHLQAQCVAHVHRSLGPLADDLRRITAGEPLPAATMAAAAGALGDAIAAVVAQLLPEHDTLTCIAVHGQTVHHAPPTTWQLLNPAPIVAATGVPVVTGQRLGDLACGGQGAPITPLADWVLYRTNESRVVLNLGGFANATALPGPNAGIDAIRGADLCPCNHLLDTFARRRLNAPFDTDGQCAAGGTVDQAAAEAFAGSLHKRVADTGAMGEMDMHVDLLDALEPLSTANAAATLADALGRVIGERCAALGDGAIAVAGGSAKHTPLVTAIEAASNRTVTALPQADSREGAALAVLALLELDGVPCTLPAVTGRWGACVPGSLWMHPLPTA
jgi:1,6-anhydro-N-acetylmuramate kinase